MDPGLTRLPSGDAFVREINELIHQNLDKEWMASQWKLAVSGTSTDVIHPFVNIAFKAHGQIQRFVESGAAGVTPEIWELGELAIKINLMKRKGIVGIDRRLTRLISANHSEYRSTRYEIQVAGMLVHRGHVITFIEEGDRKSPDLLVYNGQSKCEIECKHKEPSEDQIDYVRSIYNNTQKARKQFTKDCPGLIFIEINKSRFDEFESERLRLTDEINRSLRNSSSISAVLLTSKIDFEDQNDYVYRHRVAGFLSTNPRHRVPQWLMGNLVST